MMLRLCSLEAKKQNQVFNPPARLYYLAADSVPVEAKKRFCPFEDLIGTNFRRWALGQNLHFKRF